jgi:hypothetical protein
LDTHRGKAKSFSPPRHQAKQEANPFAVLGGLGALVVNLCS